jgi:putative flavoprotein involved in K+ transport
VVETREHLPVVVVGGGQAGLAAAYHLKRARIEFAVLDRHQRVGDSWRRRWSSLKLFTPARIDGLPGMRFPAPAYAHPTRDEMAAFLETYAARFELPVRSGCDVQRLEHRDGLFRLCVNGVEMTADRVIVATGANEKPRVPAWASELDPGIRQLSAATYGSPADLLPGDVLVVGAGNSGSEIALEAAAAGHRVLLSGRDTGEGNGRVFRPLPWWIGTHFLTTSTPIGRRMARRMASGGAPRFWITPADFEKAGVERVPRTVEAAGGRPRLEDGRVLDVSTVVWCTGFLKDFGWIEPPVQVRDGSVIHERGVSATPGLYFLGLPFQHSVASTLVGGVGIDARHVVRHVARSLR